MALTIRTAKYPTGERVPLLFTVEPFYSPLFFPLIWVTLNRRSKARKSIEKDMRSLRVFYGYCAGTNFDLEAAIARMDFDLILERFNGFGYWLKSREKAPASSRLGSDPGQNREAQFLEPQTINGYLWSVSMFLAWCIRRYVSPQRLVLDRVDEVLWRRDLLCKELDRLCEGHAMKSGSRDGNDCAGLDPDDIHKLRKFIEPNGPSNPYAATQRVRNWVIFNTLAETGMRLSELLNLQTGDHREVNGRYFVSILDRTNDPADSRRNEPGFKTLERTLEISSELYEMLNDYIDFHRRPLDSHGRPIRFAHKYLFANMRGEPLGAVTVSRIFEPLKGLIECPHLSAHVLRHSFANHFLEFLVDQKGVPLEAALDQLRYLGGWSAASRMPQRYGKRYIAKLANRMNRQRVESAWERVRRYE